MQIQKSGLEFVGLEQRGVTDQIVLHHTGNPTDDDLSAAEIHASHKAQGWAGIGYHYVVRKDGAVEEGRPHWTVGAHAYGDNSHTIGIHLCGNFEIGTPTPAQIEGAATLLAQVCGDYGLPIDAQHVVGHRDLMATACPGRNLYAVLQTIRGKAIWYQQHPPAQTGYAAIWDAIAALEVAAAGVPIDQEIWALKQKLKALESAEGRI